MFGFFAIGLWLGYLGARWEGREREAQESRTIDAVQFAHDCEIRRLEAEIDRLQAPRIKVRKEID